MRGADQPSGVEGCGRRGDPSCCFVGNPSTRCSALKPSTITSFRLMPKSRDGNELGLRPFGSRDCGKHSRKVCRKAFWSNLTSGPRSACKCSPACSCRFGAELARTPQRAQTPRAKVSTGDCRCSSFASGESASGKASELQNISSVLRHPPQSLQLRCLGLFVGRIMKVDSTSLPSRVVSSATPEVSSWGCCGVDRYPLSSGC